MPKTKNYKKAFENEMRLKNEAYFFILENGLLQDFSEWKKEKKNAGDFPPKKPLDEVWRFCIPEQQETRIGFQPSYMKKN